MQVHGPLRVAHLLFSCVTPEHGLITLAVHHVIFVTPEHFQQRLLLGKKAPVLLVKPEHILWQVLLLV
jgi:hypothetical protein